MHKIENYWNGEFSYKKSVWVEKENERLKAEQILTASVRYKYYCRFITQRPVWRALMRTPRRWSFDRESFSYQPCRGDWSAKRDYSSIEFIPLYSRFLSTAPMEPDGL